MNGAANAEKGRKFPAHLGFSVGGVASFIYDLSLSLLIGFHRGKAFAKTQGVAGVASTR